MFLLLGFGVGCLYASIAFLIMFIFSDAKEDGIWSVGSALAGLVCAGLSAIIGVITALYWKYVASKTPVLYPELAGFKFLLSFFAAFFGGCVSIWSLGCLTNI